MTNVYAVVLTMSVEMRTPEQGSPEVALMLDGTTELAAAPVSPARLEHTPVADIITEELPGLFRRWLGVDSR